MAVRQRYARIGEQLPRGVSFVARTALRALECVRRRCADRNFDCGIASASSELERRLASPAREDLGAFDDRNYAANSTSARMLDILHARRRSARPPIPPPGARPSESANLAQEPSKLMFSFRKMRHLKPNRNNQPICTESEAEPHPAQSDTGSMSGQRFQLSFFLRPSGSIDRLPRQSARGRWRDEACRRRS